MWKTKLNWLHRQAYWFDSAGNKEIQVGLPYPWVWRPMDLTYHRTQSASKASLNLPEVPPACLRKLLGGLLKSAEAKCSLLLPQNTSRHDQMCLLGTCAPRGPLRISTSMDLVSAGGQGLNPLWMNESHWGPTCLNTSFESYKVSV